MNHCDCDPCASAQCNPGFVPSNRFRPPSLAVKAIVDRAMKANYAQAPSLKKAPRQVPPLRSPLNPTTHALMMDPATKIAMQISNAKADYAPGPAASRAGAGRRAPFAPFATPITIARPPTLDVDARGPLVKPAPIPKPAHFVPMATSPERKAGPLPLGKKADDGTGYNGASSFAPNLVAPLERPTIQMAGAKYTTSKGNRSETGSKRAGAGTRFLPISPTWLPKTIAMPLPRG
jgi:hypothetical protein